MFDMDKERSIRFTPGKWIRHDYFLPAIAVAAFLIFIRLVYFPWGEGNIDWPSWVQAVGSVAAILVAIWVAQRQHQEVINQRLLDQKIVRKSVALIGRRAYESILKMDRVLNPMPTERTVASARVALDQIRAVNIFTLPSETLIDAVATLARCLESSLSIYDYDSSSDKAQYHELFLLAHVAVQALDPRPGAKK